MSNKGKILKATHTGELKVGEINIPCFVLEDGRRVLSGRGMQGALGLGQMRGQKINQLTNNSSIKPFINESLSLGISEPIEFTTVNNLKAFGYEANVLVEICDVLLQARKKNAVPKRYNETVEYAEMLVRSFAKIGIIALVDEATGYQYDREKDALQVILKAYINDELLKWQQKFPDTFYFEIFRLNKWDYTVNGIKKRPGVIGTWTNELIYKQLPKGVLDELKSKTPKSEAGNYTARFFQSLTPDIGHPALTAQIYKVIGIMNISNTWEEFKSSFNRMVDRANGQTELNFEEIEKKINQEDKPIELNSFDKKLKKALNFNPKIKPEQDGQIQMNLE